MAFPNFARQPWGQDFLMRSTQLPADAPPPGPTKRTTKALITVEEAIITDVVFYEQEIPVVTEGIVFNGNGTITIDLLPDEPMTEANTFILATGAVRRAETFLQPNNIDASLTDNVANQIEVYPNGEDTLSFYIKIEQYV